VVARAEHDADTGRLVAALRAQGWQVTGTAADGLRVTGGPPGSAAGPAAVDPAAVDPAAVNRAAAAAGITLRGLLVAQESLEDVFLAMTGEDDRDVSAARAAAAGK
jgi:ABC-2 type transport system ATP-binding protein